jgi:hypothetical protein
MKKSTVNKHSVLPIIVMIAFILLLVGALVFRVYRADRDLGMIRIAKRQARLAAETGAFFALHRMQQLLQRTDKTTNTNLLTANYFSNHLDIDVWKDFGQKSRASFRIIGLRRISGEDLTTTPLINEAQRFQILSEGRSGRHRYTTASIIQLYDLAEVFAVFSSLDEYYYGLPIQPWIEHAQSLEAFVKANEKIFNNRLLDRFGVCYDPGLLVKMFAAPGSDPFKAVDEQQKLRGNYGITWFKDGKSPANGPIYCETPIVVDSHEFKAPVQTALYLFRRGSSQPVITQGNSVIAINSSLRVQQAADSLEGKNPPNMIVDRDSDLYSSYIPEWRPDFNYLRELAKKSGIYIDKEGKGHKNGNLIDVNYFPGEDHLFSDSYKTPNSTGWEQDELNNKHIVLSTDTRFEGYNNLSSENLGGARIIFSERSVYFRGDIGSDLVVVTPGHIFITGPTNVDSSLNLFLIGKNGTALSTVDLEKYISENNPEPEFVEAASEWLINALVYKPGAGIYTTTSRQLKFGALNFRRLFAGKSLKVRINGACIGGNLKRWMDNMEPNGVQVSWNKTAASRLSVKPVTANILRMRTRPER